MKQLLTLIAGLLLSAQIAQAQQEAVNPQVTIHTDRGDIRLELYPQQAPITVENFLQYARDGF